MRVSTRIETVSDAESRARGDRLIAWARDYAARRINSRMIDERRTVPPYVVLDFGNQGFFGMQVEEALGGLGLRSRDIGRVLVQLAAIDLGLATFLLTSLFPGVRPIAGFASPALRRELLPQLASGRMLAGYAQTEETAGTDFASMQARAEVAPGGGWRVTGDKIWIGNSSWAGVLTVMAREHDEQGRRRGMLALAVRTDQPGVVIGRELLSMGMRGMVQGEVGFRGAQVSPDQLVGERDRALDVGVDSMSWSRFAIAATCIGAMKRCVQLAVRFGARRSIATGKLIEHPVVLSRLGESVAATAACDALLSRTAAVLDSGAGVPVDVFAALKVIASERLWTTVDSTVQMLGSRGYDESNGLPQLLRDARVTRVFEGPSEALVAFLGAQALSARSDLFAFLRGELGAADVADALEAGVRELRARESGARPWECALAGQAAIAALCVGAVACERASGADSLLAKWGEDWARAELARRLADLRAPGEGERTRIERPDAEKAAESFAQQIGDVDLRLPGERIGQDPLLRAEPS